MQLISQAPHSMHLSRSIIWALLFFISNTLCGHTSRHILQPVHNETSYSRVVTFLRYLWLSIYVNCDKMSNVNPARAKAIWMGTNNRISIFTPLSEVYVLAPVKFMVRKEATAPEIRSHPMRYKSGSDEKLRTATNPNMSNPITSPFPPKCLKGNHGSSTGPRKAPAK